VTLRANSVKASVFINCLKNSKLLSKTTRIRACFPTIFANVLLFLITSIKIEMEQNMSPLQRAIQAEFPVEYSYTDWLDLVPIFVRTLAERYYHTFQAYQARHRVWLQEGDWSNQPRYPLPPADLLDAVEVLYKLYAAGSVRDELVIKHLLSFRMEWKISVSDKPLEPLRPIQFVQSNEKQCQELRELKSAFASANLSLNQSN
jgi:hypothetical protein